MDVVGKGKVIALYVFIIVYYEYVDVRYFLNSTQEKKNRRKKNRRRKTQKKTSIRIKGGDDLSHVNRTKCGQTDHQRTDTLSKKGIR